MILCLVDGDPVSLEALTFARGLGDVEALIFEETDVDGYTAHARRVVHPRLGDYAPEAWAQAIVELEPEVVVAPGTDRGHEVLAHVAARLGVPLAANVVAATADGDALQLTRQRWGGSLLEEARLTGTPKLLTVAAHAVVAQPAGVTTTTEKVRQSRAANMEFLLINHPLDCPICDQAGECKLQDNAVGAGLPVSRTSESRRQFPGYDRTPIGPHVIADMTRCIQCTRCVRYMTEVAGVEELGAIGRGEDMEITTYLEHAMTSELQSNVVDLCPVGALTSKPYAFAARPWELNKTESIDVMDALGSDSMLAAVNTSLTPRAITSRAASTLS